ncbi:uncharacterized protein LOC135094125 [Scylla paramamosain]|uniref:uncharacterized protein LOC135094125 n=1 Tax=Scylla paramamosain TaxID=85552 RepID=UPI003082D857
MAVVMVVVAASDKVKRQVYYSDAAPPSRPRPRPQYQEPHSSSSYESEENSIPGEPGVDYPIYHTVPYTKFTCEDVPFRPGIYANPEAGCQVYHVCDDNRYGPQGAQFLCTNGTVFNQEVFTCDWWYNVDCSKATSFYSLNADPDHNPYYQKPYEGPLNTPRPLRQLRGGLPAPRPPACLLPPSPATQLLPIKC